MLKAYFVVFFPRCHVFPEATFLHAHVTEKPQWQQFLQHEVKRQLHQGAEAVQAGAQQRSAFGEEATFTRDTPRVVSPPRILCGSRPEPVDSVSARRAFLCRLADLQQKRLLGSAVAACGLILGSCVDSLALLPLNLFLMKTTSPL